MQPATAPARRIRVLHVVQNLNYGGMERVLSDIVLRADPQRFETHVLCLQFAGRYAEGLHGAATVHVAEPMSRWSMLRPVALAATIRTIAPDVVHSHSGVWHKASLAARMAGVPRVIHTEHGRLKPEPLQTRIVDGIAARRTDRVVAVSAQLAEELPVTLRVPREKIVTVANGVDTGTFQPQPDNGVLRRELGIAPDAPIIGSIGRLNHIKGYDVMIEAFARFRAMQSHPDAVLVVAGHGADRAALDARVVELGLSEHVRLLGWRDDVHDMHAAFTIFTMSSRSEGTSISLLEAMSAGIAPVVTDVGGNAAVLGPALGREALVPSEAPDALAERWAALLGDAARRTRTAAAARSRVIDAFGLDAMVRAYEAIYAPELATGATAAVASAPALGAAAAPSSSS